MLSINTMYDNSKNTCLSRDVIFKEEKGINMTYRSSQATTNYVPNPVHQRGSLTLFWLHYLCCKYNNIFCPEIISIGTKSIFSV